MDRVRRCSNVPVCAGFGIRSRGTSGAFRTARGRRGGRLGLGRSVGERRGCGRVFTIRCDRHPGNVMKRVYRAASLLQVAHARNVLITAGIESELRNQYLAGALGDCPCWKPGRSLWVDDDLVEGRAVRPREVPPPHPGCAMDLRAMRGEARAAVHHLLALRSPVSDPIIPSPLRDSL